MNVTMRWVPGFFVCLLLFGLAACGGNNGGEAAGTGSGADAVARIEGTVFYRERMLLPPGAEVEIQLQDISRADAMATVLAAVLLHPQSGPPYHFAVEYDPATIDKRMRYALRATISEGDRLLFSSNEYIDPFQGNPVEILVTRVPEPVRREAPVLEGATWTLQTLGGEPAGNGAGGKPLDIQFVASEMRAGGFSGCNRYTGGYSRDGADQRGSPLKFGPIAGTLMACEEGSDLEQKYLQMLGGVTAFRLDGDTLQLLAGPEVVATFKNL